MKAHLGAALASAAVLGAAGCGGGGDEAAAPAGTHATTPAATTAEAPPATTAAAPAPVELRISVVGGRPEGGIRRETVQQGETVALVVESDVAGLAHVHGYNLDLSLTPGVPARLEFVADVVGRVEIELHGDVEVQIADLSVLP
ncbi:MAG: hypothetical protein HY511_00485 [Actinobacteria bacterium]|nr:hypothetical protein [Actinomycetota bacterium]